MIHARGAARSRLLPLVLAVALCGVGVIVLGAAPAQAGPPPVMYGYVPLPADDMHLALATVNAGASSTMRFTVGITNAAAGSTMYYDQWEDGYEADIANPSQSTTLVFGDGNTGNGDAADYCGANCTGDVLPQGAPLVMQNDIPTPRNANNLFFDGRDKVASTRGFTITAGGFTTPLGSVLSMVVSAYDTSKYANDYTAPVGTNTPVPALTSDAFNYSGLLVQAAADNTLVEVDTDADGIDDASQIINEGETYLVNGGVFQGATVHSSKPVMVHEITGDTTANYEARSFNLFPDKVLWSDYMSPAGSSVDNFRTVNFLYNPNDAAITVTPTCTSCSGTLNVPAHDGVAFTSPLGEAVRFSTTGAHFSALAGVGAQSGAAPGAVGDSSTNWDWGYTLIPTTQLTTQVVLGWAPGNSNVDPSLPIGNRDDDPVWFTTLNATTLSVDYDGDPTTGALATSDCFGARHDVDLSVAALASTRIHDPNDGNMTGARIYTCDGTAIAGAWGEDPANAPTGNPGFDAGYTVIPTTTMLVHKTATVTYDDNNDGMAGPGDSLTYVIEIADAGSLAFSNVKLADTLPAGITYVPESTVFDDGSTVTSLTDDGPNPNSPTFTPFPLDDAGMPLPDIGAGDTVEVRFKASVDASAGASIGNTACVTAAEASACDTSITPLAQADLSLTKTVVTPAIFVGDNVTFRLTVANAGPDSAAGVVVAEYMPSDLTYVSDDGGGAYDAVTGLWAVPTLADGGTATLDITATVTAVNVTNTAEVLKAGNVDPDSLPGDWVGDDAAAAEVIVAPMADVEVTTVVTQAPAFLGDVATFLVTLTNNGPSDSTGTAVHIAQTPGLTPISFVVPTGSFSQVTGLWTTSVPAGTSQTFEMSSVLASALPQTATAEVVNANEFDPDSTPDNAVLSEDDRDSAGVSASGGSIGDRLWDDVDGDGAQDSGEAGIEGVSVTLLRDADLDPDYETTIGTVVTSGDGDYSFGDLLPGSYRIVVDPNTLPAGFVCTNCAAPRDLALTGGQTLTTADYGYRAEADLSLTNVVSDPAAFVGDHGTFTITVTNNGPAAATGVLVGNTLPSGVTFSSATPSQGSFNPATGVWTVGTLADGASATLVLDVITTTSGSLVDTAQVTASDQPDPDSTPDNNLGTEDDHDAASLSPAPRIDLALTQVADKETVNVGDTVTITLTLTNQGPSAATGVAVTDTLPAGLVADSYTPSQGTCVANVCALGTVASNGTATITIVAHATSAGALENLAEVTAATETDVDSQPAEDALTVPNQDDETALVVTGIQIDLSLTMTVSKSAVPVGDSVVWTLTLHNAGPSAATGVKVTDVLPAGLSLLDATAGTGAYDPATDTWSIATLAPDGTATLTITTRVDQAGAHLNSAQVKAASEPDADSTPNNNLATEDDQDSANVTGTLGNVAGTLWIDTNGNGIVDPSEPTLPGVTVKLVDGAGNVVATAVTDAQGNYTFPNVSPGTYELVVDPATLPLTVGGLTYDADAILNGRHTIVVSGRGATNTNFGYAPAVAQAELPRTGGTSQLPLAAGLLAVVLSARARRRLRTA